MKKMVWWVGNKLSRTNPLYVMGLVLLYLLVIWLACFLIDVRNLMGLREILVIKDYLVMEGEKVPLWFFVFREAGPTEILQWMIFGNCSLQYCFIPETKETGYARTILFLEINKHNGSPHVPGRCR